MRAPRQDDTIPPVDWDKSLEALLRKHPNTGHPAEALSPPPEAPLNSDVVNLASAAALPRQSVNLAVETVVTIFEDQTRKPAELAAKQARLLQTIRSREG